MNYNSGYGSYGGIGGLYGAGMYGNSMYRGGYGGLYGSSDMYGGKYIMVVWWSLWNRKIPIIRTVPFISPRILDFFYACEHVAKSDNPCQRSLMLVPLSSGMNIILRLYGYLVSLQLFDCSGVLYGELARFVLRLLGSKTKSKKINPPGPDGLPLPGPDNSSVSQNYIEGTKPARSGSWDNVWEKDTKK